MNNLVNQINDFINKQVKFRSAREAAEYGIKLPAGELKPKMPEYKPKMPKTTIPRGTRTVQPRRKLPTEGAFEEVARQLSPKGPGYRSPEEVMQDIKESKRLARKITGIGKPEKEKG